MSSTTPPGRPGRAYLAGPPLLVAHRGGSGLAPENTLVAFGQALDRWRADMLELDVRLSRDGEVMVIHDATVDRTTDATGPVSTYRCAELQALDAGARFADPSGESSFQGRGVFVPTLDQVLESFPHARVNIEVKEPQVADPAVDVVRRHEARDRVLLAAGRERSRRSVVDWEGPWGASQEQVFRFWLLRHLRLGTLHIPPVDVFQVPERWRGLRIVSPSFVRAAHRHNIPVQVWTVDEADTMRRLLSWGVDGIQTDRPDRLARVLHEETGRPLPPALAPGG